MRRTVKRLYLSLDEAQILAQILPHYLGLLTHVGLCRPEVNSFHDSLVKKIERSHA